MPVHRRVSCRTVPTMAGAEWARWLEQHHRVLESAGTTFEWTFANLVLSRVTSLTPDVVSVQKPFTDSDGSARRMDFAIADGSVRIAIEVDGYNKVPGVTTGMTSDEFTEFLRRQTSLAGQGWMVLRFTNKDFTKNASRCIREIELALKQARSSQPLSSSEAQELAALRHESNDVQEQLREAQRRAEEAERRGKEAEQDALRQRDLRERAERTNAAGAVRRRWLIGGIAVAVVAAATTGALYVGRERLPGVAPASRTECPTDAPIKGNRSANASTKIYHLPGGAFYNKTTPVRCFASEDDAVAAGYRRSKV